MGFQLANITILNDYYFYGFIPLVFILLFMINKRYIKNVEEYKSRKNYRIWLFISKLIIFIVLIIALTSPSIELQKQDDSVLSIDVLLDNTTSM